MVCAEEVGLADAEREGSVCGDGGEVEGADFPVEEPLDGVVVLAGYLRDGLSVSGARCGDAFKVGGIVYHVFV